MITMSDNDFTKPDPSPRQLSRTERIGIYGGTFSPVHSGHIRAANCFLDCVGLDRLYMVPTALPPHKAAVDGASDADRLEMLRLAIADDRIYARAFYKAGARAVYVSRHGYVSDA